MTSFCPNCGATVNGSKFCVACGTKLEEAAVETPVVEEVKEEAAAPIPVPAPMPVQQPIQQPVQASPRQAMPVQQMPMKEPVPPKGSAYEPISTGGYIGIFLLLSVPVVGWIFAIVWACGGCKKINKRNMCRAMLIMTLIGIIIAALCALGGYIFMDMLVNALESYM